MLSKRLGTTIDPDPKNGMKFSLPFDPKGQVVNEWTNGQTMVTLLYVL